MQSTISTTERVVFPCTRIVAGKTYDWSFSQIFLSLFASVKIVGGLKEHS